MRKKILGLLLVLCLLPQEIWAHFLWINPQKYRLQPGEGLKVTLGFGHHFPGAGGDLLKGANLKELKLILADGRDIPLKAPSDSLVFETSSTLAKEGTALLGAEKKAGFFTKTVSGFYHQSKKGLANVLVCKYSRRFAKALITVGKPRGKIFQKVLGQELEIIPLKDPATLKAGDWLPLKVLFKGKPYRKKWVLATYEGFSSSDRPAFSYATRTDYQGRAFVRLDHRGIWLIAVFHEEPYPEREVCDVSTVVSTLTFELY